MMISVAQFTIRGQNDIEVGATAPSDPVEGMLWIDTKTSELKKYTWDGDEHIWAITTGGELSEQMQEQVTALLKQLEEAEKAAKDAAEAAEAAQTEAGLVRTEVTSKFKELDDLISDTFTTTKTYIDDENGVTRERVVVIESVFKREPGPIVTLAASDKATKLVLTTEGLSVQSDAGMTLADFTTTGANVPRLAVTEQITLGNAVWVMHENGTSSIMGR